MTSDFQNLLEELYNLQRLGIKTGLEHTRELLKAVGNPHHKLKFVHVAGTNGKGSTCALLYNILKQAGKKVGLYTSPHLLNFNERIRVNGHTISNEEIVDFMRNNYNHIINIQTTFFETTTVMALDHFSKHNVDIAIIETGLGGRLDSTNVIMPEVSVITSISMDHLDILGESITKIAEEKAGIIKDFIPLILAGQGKYVNSIILEKARIKNSPVTIVHPKNATLIKVDSGGTSFSYDGNKFRVSLSGEHQVLNCMMAIEAAKKVCNNLNYNKINKACCCTKWPGRMERLTNHSIYYDVAHNASGISVILDTVKTIHPEKSIIGLFCLKGDKEIDRIVKAINGHFSQLLITSDERGLLLPVDRLSSLLSNCQLKYTLVSSVADGIIILREKEKKGSAGLIFGSHYIANEIYRAFEISFERGDI